MIPLPAGRFSHRPGSIPYQVSPEVIPLRQMGFLFSQESESARRAELHALRVSPAQFAFHQRSPFGIIRDGAERATDHTHPTPDARVMIHRDTSGLTVLPDAQGRAEVEARGFVALLASDYIKDEIILIGHVRDGVALVPYNLDS
jgi:hypothetical protein